MHHNKEEEMDEIEQNLARSERTGESLNPRADPQRALYCSWDNKPW